jgi:hypothetical protein
MASRFETRDLWSVLVLVWAAALLAALLAVPVFFGWTAEGWAALAQWVTAGVALAAAIFALRQVQEARRTRERQAQPNVVVFADLNADDWHWLDVIVKNFGQTPAYNVRLRFDPWPTVTPWIHPVSHNRITRLLIPDLPVLVPGQEWRTLWQEGPAVVSAEADRRVVRDAQEAGMPVHPSFVESLPDDVGMRFDGCVTFEDRAHRQYTNPCVLDLHVYLDMRRQGP